MRGYGGDKRCVCLEAQTLVKKQSSLCFFYWAIRPYTLL